MKNMRSLLVTISIFLISGCVSTKVMKEESTLESLIEKYRNKNVNLFILNNSFSSTFKDLKNGDLIIMVDSSEMVIPVGCVTQIRIDTGGRGTQGMIIGGIIGGTLGLTSGWLAAREASTSDINAIGHPVTLGMFVGGASVGAIIGAGSKTVKHYNFSSTAKSYVLHTEVGEDITPAEIKLFSIFEDLKQKYALLLLVRIIHYGENSYLLVYDVVFNGEYLTKLEKVDENYLQVQKEKINKVLSSSGK